MRALRDKGTKSEAGVDVLDVSRRISVSAVLCRLPFIECVNSRRSQETANAEHDPTNPL